MNTPNNLQYTRGQVLSIGQLATQTGVAITALRYYDELGLVTADSRSGGQRRYHQDAVNRIGAVLFLRDVGLSLEEIGRFLRDDDWRALVERKIVELDELAAKLRTARVALQHSLQCPNGQPATCPKFWSIIEQRRTLPSERANDVSGHAAVASGSQRDRPR